MASTKRDQLIDTALKIFNRDGFHATGVDKIIGEAGVARMTLYKHFKSKDELILAVLRRRDEQFRNDFMRAVERLGKSPRDRLLAIFDVLGNWFAERTFSGCMFINASAEFAPRDNPIHRASGEHKTLMQRYITELVEATAASAPDELAASLMLLAEGAIVMAYVADDDKAAIRAKSAAEALIQQAGL